MEDKHVSVEEVKQAIVAEVGQLAEACLRARRCTVGVFLDT